MKKYPMWTETQFRELLASESVSDEELGECIGRTPGAVAVVREGVKNWRQGKGNVGGILNRMMVTILSETGDK